MADFGEDYSLNTAGDDDVWYMTITARSMDISPANFYVAFEFTDGYTGQREVDSSPLLFQENRGVKVGVETNHKGGTWVGMYLEYQDTDNTKAPFQFAKITVDRYWGNNEFETKTFHHIPMLGVNNTNIRLFDPLRYPCEAEKKVSEC